MTQVSTHLFYGLFVTTPSLLIASEAFTKIQPCFLAINLIQTCQLKSQLDIATASSTSVSALTKFPGEVWSLIKDELIGIQLQESEKLLVWRMTCDCHRDICNFRNGYRCHSYHPRLDPPTTWERMSEIECDNCLQKPDSIFAFGKVWSDMNGFRVKVDRFLKLHSLEIVGSGFGGETDYDINSLTPIAISKVKSQECHHFEQATPFHAITSLSASDFELPFSVKFISRQFKLLQKVYGIKVSDYKKKIEKSQKPQVVPKMKVAVKDVDIKAVEKWREPSWTLWTEGENEW